MALYCTFVPHFFSDGSGAVFHADQEPYKNLGLKINRNQTVDLQSFLLSSTQPSILAAYLKL